SNVDTISDFKHDTDVIQLENSVFKTIGPTLEAGEFFAKRGATKAHDADDRIVYDKSTGKLYYDDDGKGGHAAVHFATLSNKPTLDHGDFAIV
ncbi:MAG TPA: calcium-binding protein, partial [Reyranella sp.]|nr:calcium-binding protein [Reyranella sp.]